MKLWKISQSVNEGYDTYDSAVVAAASEAEARQIHPQGTFKLPSGELYNPWEDRWVDSWAQDPRDVKVELLGEALEGTEAGIVLASFNAG